MPADFCFRRNAAVCFEYFSINSHDLILKCFSFVFWRVLYWNLSQFYNHRLNPGILHLMIGSMLLLWVDFKCVYMFSIKWCCTVHVGFCDFVIAIFIFTNSAEDENSFSITKSSQPDAVPVDNRQQLSFLKLFTYNLATYLTDI